MRRATRGIPWPGARRMRSPSTRPGPCDGRRAGRARRSRRRGRRLSQTPRAPSACADARTGRGRVGPAGRPSAQRSCWSPRAAARQSASMTRLSTRTVARAAIPEARSISAPRQRQVVGPSGRRGRWTSSASHDAGRGRAACRRPGEDSSPTTPGAVAGAGAPSAVGRVRPAPHRRRTSASSGHARPARSRSRPRRRRDTRRGRSTRAGRRPA